MEERADKRLRNPVLITGASGGIGYELSRLFARDGHDLILVSRNEARLEEVAEEFGKSFGVRSLVLAKDLAVPGSPNELFEELERSSVEVDVLEPVGAPAWSRQEIEAALESPVGSPPLEQLARGGQSACAA